MFLGLMAFISCDDNESETGGENQNQPSLPSLGITDPVTAIDYGGGLSTFNYAEGKLVGGYDYGYQEADMTISYSPLSIKGYDEEVEAGYSSVFELIYSNICTNNMGCITSADIAIREIEKDDRGGSMVDYEETQHITAQYNEEGYLTQWNIQAVYDEEGVACRTSIVITREWNNGNLMRIHWYIEDYEGDSNVPVEDPDEGWLTFTYADNAPKNNGIYLDEMIYDSDVVTYAGFWGKTTKCIPASSEVTDGDHNPQNSFTYSVDLDEKGRIVTFYSDGDVAMRYGYADSPLTTKLASHKLKSVKQRCLLDRIHRNLYK